MEVSSGVDGEGRGGGYVGQERDDVVTHPVARIAYLCVLPVVGAAAASLDEEGRCAGCWRGDRYCRSGHSRSK